MNNLQQPAFPLGQKTFGSWDKSVAETGFTKLEYAAILIAQGMCANGIFQADEAVLRAKLVLDECNK